MTVGCLVGYILGTAEHVDKLQPSQGGVADANYADKIRHTEIRKSNSEGDAAS
jgi:hypothetical protein